MKYKIISSDTAEDLEKQVNDKLEAHWQCQGGVSVSAVVFPAYESNDYHPAESVVGYLQAMIYPF